MKPQFIYKREFRLLSGEDSPHLKGEIMNNIFVYLSCVDPTRCQLAAVFFEPSTGRTGEKFVFEGEEPFSRGILPHEAIGKFGAFITDNLKPDRNLRPLMWFGSGAVDNDILVTDFYAHKMVPPWNLGDFRDCGTLVSVAQAGGWDAFFPLKPNADISKHATTCAALIGEAWQFLIAPRLENWRHESEYSVKKLGACE